MLGLTPEQLLALRCQAGETLDSNLLPAVMSLVQRGLMYRKPELVMLEGLCYCVYANTETGNLLLRIYDRLK